MQKLKNMDIAAWVIKRGATSPTDGQNPATVTSRDGSTQLFRGSAGHHLKLYNLLLLGPEKKNNSASLSLSQKILIASREIQEFQWPFHQILWVKSVRSSIK